jgi:hypothetical protein
MATVGKMVYYDNPRRLAIMVGDKGLQNISISEDDLLQDYRLFIERSETPEQGINNGNALLFTLLQAQLIDQPIFSNLFNRATPDLIADALRQHARDKAQAQNMAEKANVMSESEALVAGANAKDQMAQAQEEQMMSSLAMNQMQHNNEMDKIALKEGAKNEREAIKKLGL